jgi:hypothetical protein
MSALPKREIQSISSDDDLEVLEQIRRNHLEKEAADEEIDEETDVEHENTPREEPFENEEDINPAIRERINNLTQILGADRHEDEDEEESQRSEQLEELLGSFEQNEISIEEWTEVTLEDSLSRLLGQHRSFKICRRPVFCPEENRTSKPIRNLAGLANHMQRGHGASKEDTEDMVRYFISKMLPTKIKIEAKTEQAKTVNRHWIFGRCHHPGCNYLSIRNTATEIHIKNRHTEVYQDIKELGWFWGTIRTII